MPEWHQLDSSSTMVEQQESAKKKTLKSSSRSFWFSTGLIVFGFCFFIHLSFLICNNLTKFFLHSLGVKYYNCFVFFFFLGGGGGVCSVFLSLLAFCSEELYQNFSSLPLLARNKILSLLLFWGCFFFCSVFFYPSYLRLLL